MTRKALHISRNVRARLSKYGCNREAAMLSVVTELFVTVNNVTILNTA